MKQKENIFEELNKMKRLINAKAGTVISEQNIIDTDIETVKKEISKGALVDSDEQKVVDVLKKYGSNKAVFKNFLTQYKTTTGTELTDVLSKVFQANRDQVEIKDLNSVLSKLGITFEVGVNPEKTKFVASFKGLDTAASSGTANTDELWKNPKVSCVTTQPGVKGSKIGDGSTAYFLNGVTYYNNGRKRLSDKTVANYSCSTEFKTPNTQQRQQYLKNITNYSNEIQKSLGITPTGKLSNIDLDKIISSL